MRLGVYVQLIEGKLSCMLGFCYWHCGDWIDKDWCRIEELECVWEGESWSCIQNRQFSCSDECLNSREEDESISEFTFVSRQL